MVHYIPATIENLTEATAYVMDKNNEQKMKDMVKSANSWCQRTLIEKVFIDDAMIQIDEYSKTLDGMNNNWQDEWKHVKNRFTSSIDDLVDCEVRNIVSYFID